MRLFLSIFVTVLLVLTSFQLWLSHQFARESDASISSDAPVDIGGDFTLTNQRGERVSMAQLNGKVLLVFFGFTHCPAICPLGLSTLSQAMERLGDAADSVVPVFISVDPERDTPEVIQSYLSAFDARMLGLTGTVDEVEIAKKAYKVYAAKVAMDSMGNSDDDSTEETAPAKPEAAMAEGDYMVNHSSYIYLMDAQGRFLKVFSHDAPVDDVVQAVRDAQGR